VSEKVKQSLRCELDISYGPSDREKYDIITSCSTLHGEKPDPNSLFFHDLLLQDAIPYDRIGYQIASL